MTNRKISFALLLILLFGLILAIFLVRQATQVKQQASGVTNLNTAVNILKTNNSDGTMGSVSYLGNYSNSLPKEDLGSLTFSITDPVLSDSAFPTHIPTITPSSDVSTSQKNTSGSTDSNQKVTSLIIKIGKIEVHLSKEGTNSNLMKTQDKWETLNLTQPVSMDLVQLVNGGIVNFTLTKLAAGNYSEVRIYIQSAVATLQNGKTVTLNTEGTNGTIRVVKDFEIAANKNTNIVMDIDAQQSVFYDGSKFLLKSFVSDLFQNK
jgi:preprotein translocase subunit YajC